MYSQRCVLILALVFTLVFGAPTTTRYLPTADINTISRETGLIASASSNGISLALKTSGTSSKFAVAVEKKKFAIEISVLGEAVNQMLRITVTDPKTSRTASSKVRFDVHRAGRGFVYGESPEKYLGTIENNYVKLVVNADGTMSVDANVDPSNVVKFAALDSSSTYDAAHQWFFVTLETERMPVTSQLTFDSDVLFLTGQQTAFTSSSTPITTPTALPEHGDQLYSTTVLSDYAKTANASFWKSKWWIIVLCVFLGIALIVVAGCGVFCVVKKVKSKTAGHSKSKGQAGGRSGVTGESCYDTDGLTKPSGQNTEEMVYYNGWVFERPPTIQTDTTEQKDTTVEPDTVTQTKESVTRKPIVDDKAKNAPAAKVKPIAVLTEAADKVPAATTVKATPKKDRNHQRVNGLNGSIMTNTKADKPLAAPKKPEANYRPTASLKDKNLSVDSTDDKTSAEKADKTASKKPKRLFFKKTTGTDDYPESTVTDKPAKNTSKAVSKAVAGSKDPKLTTDNDKAASQKADKTASKKPKRFYLKNPTVTADLTDTTVGDKAPVTVSSKAALKAITPKRNEDLALLAKDSLSSTKDKAVASMKDDS